MGDRPGPPEAAAATSARKTRWLSRGLESLVLGQLSETPAPAFHFDAVIVGSGYGGAVAALETTRWNPVVRPTPDAEPGGGAGLPIRVCVLERGSEYLQGMFPERFADIGGSIRFSTPGAAKPRGALEGLFDFRLGTDVNALVANGLGGGSLINAGVMKMPVASVFREARWPRTIRKHRRLDALALAVQRLLGAAPVARETPKVAALRRLAPQHFTLPPVTVAQQDGDNDAGTTLARCIDCGDCASGCNHNAKDSLDLNLLRTAQARGAEIVTGATVTLLEKIVDGWLLRIVHTERHLRERQEEPFELRARTVILAAGTFGSTELLQRSQTAGLAFSEQLGRRFSANGDIVAVVRDLAWGANAVADEATAPAARHVGPTISGLIDLRTGDPLRDVAIEDLAVPAPLRRVFEEIVTSAATLNGLLDPGGAQAPDEDEPDPAAVDPDLARDSVVVAMMVRDHAEGCLTRGSDADPRADGLTTVRWRGLRDDPRLAMAHARLHDLLEPLRAGSSGATPDETEGPRVVPNPLWQPLSDRLERVFGAQRGALLSVHPLGGCAMGDNVATGVVDPHGRVFDAGAPGALHPGLFVLDGSIVPTSLGINPSLTIATLARRGARRAAAQLRRQLTGAAPFRVDTTPPLPARRPNFAIRRHEPPAPTRIEITEQLCGTVHLSSAPASHPGYAVELTLTYAPKPVRELHSRRWQERELVVAPGKGWLRVFERGPEPGRREGERELLTAKVSGGLQVLRREASEPGQRRRRGLWAWWVNRGLRDGAQTMVSALRRGLGLEVAEPDAGADDIGFLRKAMRRWDDIRDLTGHAGAVRLMEYQLEVSDAKAPSGEPVAGFAGALRGVKRLTYGPGSNPWRQLSGVELSAFPQMRLPPRGRAGRWPRRGSALPTLSLNLDHLADKGVPLLRVVEQQDRPTALAELASFAAYVSRVVVDVHALSFRKPDDAPMREALRLPGTIDRRRARDGFDLQVAPEIDRIELPGITADAGPASIRLARYRDAGAGTDRRNPVLLIHGYSASGTTFLHPSVDGNLTETLLRAGRDVWILDMRSSCGMPSARDGWAFETLGRDDIRAAVDRVLLATGAPRIDVVAHCMGSASLNMLLLGERDGPRALHRRIGRVAMSQVGPVLRMSTDNVFRAYVMRWIKTFLPVADYAFRPAGDALGSQLLDRLLATLPYPPSEFRRENPLWPPGKATGWLSLRHRMDALYARAFKLANMPERVLEGIDDFFGPLSVETVSQVIHFARLGTLADRAGRNLFVSPFRLQSRMGFPVLYLHGAENGIVDASSVGLMREAWQRAAIPRHHLDGWPDLGGAADPFPGNVEQVARLFTWRIPGHGHQDPMIGREAGRVSAVLARFLAG